MTDTKTVPIGGSASRVSPRGIRAVPVEDGSQDRAEIPGAEMAWQSQAPIVAKIGADGFASVYRMVRQASEKLADRLERGSAPMSGQTSSTT